MKLTSNRQRRILELLDADRELHVAALAEGLEVSQETIRRDLSHLESLGALKRVHGGAISLSSPRLRPLVERADVKRQEKDEIAKLAASLVGKGQTVFLGEGTTVLALAQRLVDRVSARYMTTMIDVAQLLAANPRNEVSLTGGVLRAEHNVLFGHGTLDSVQKRHFDIAITASSGIHPELGFLDYNDDYANLYRTLRRHAKRYVILADHSKFGKGPPICTFSFEEVDAVVTDRKPSQRFRTAFQKAGTALLLPDDEASLHEGSAASEAGGAA